MFYSPSHPPAVSPYADSSSNQGKHADLTHDIERLLMITEALWAILKEKHGYTDSELMRRVALIDLRDGKLDGKVSKVEPAPCPRCGKVLNKRHPRCIYCGEAIVQDPFLR